MPIKRRIGPIERAYLSRALRLQRANAKLSGEYFLAQSLYDMITVDAEEIQRQTAKPVSLKRATMRHKIYDLRQKGFVDKANSSRRNIHFKVTPAGLRALAEKQREG